LGGSLTKEKGHADLIRAAALLHRRKLSDFRVVLAGDGPERESLIRLARKLDVEREVTVAGFQKNIRPYYRLVTLLALASHSEGFPNVMLEAMAAGLPIAATSVGGIPEALGDNVTGLMVPPGEPESLANAMLGLLIDPGLRISLAAAANKKAEADFALRKYLASLSQFYQETIEAQSHPRLRGRPR
jgi:glycosyltransferase involved in cell wall biosynthesis